MKQNSKKLKSHSITFAVAAVLATAPSLFAAPSTPTAEGLSGLDDHAVAAELSGRGLTHLLDHYFQANHTPSAEQQAIKTFGAMRELRDPNSKITVGEKIRRVKEVADGIDTLLASMHEPLDLVETAGLLLKYVVNPKVNDLEYWGEDPRTQTELKPSADAVIKLLDAAATNGRKQADALANRLGNGANQALANQWQTLDDLTNNAAYGKLMSVYFAAASRSSKDAERNKMAADAIAGLAAFDNADSQIQPRVHNMLAKLQMTSGDLPTAKATFATVSDPKSKLVPAPDPYERHEALYFTVVCDLMGRQLNEAKADKAALDKYSSTQLVPALQAMKISQSDIDAGMKSFAAAEMLLQWRVHLLESDLAKTPGDKEKANSAAETVLNKLREAHPELSVRIEEQIVKRMNTSQPINDKMQPSLLIALERKGLGEVFKTPDEKPDATVIKRGMEAAQALIARKGAAGITKADLEDAQLAIAQLQEHQGDKVAAANAYLDYASDYYSSNPTKATQAFEHAGFFVFQLKKMQPNAPAGFAALYNRFMPLAIKQPYNHLEQALPWGEELNALGQYAEAIKYFKMTPKDSPQYAMSKYREMQAWDGLLRTKLSPTEHGQAVGNLTAAAEESLKLSDPPKDEYERNRAITCALELADVNRIEKNNLSKAKDYLEQADKLINGINGPQNAARKADLQHSLLITRINIELALKNVNGAIQLVVQLLAAAKGDEGIDFVRVLLAQLDKEFAAADLAHNTQVMRDTAQKEATLTGYLVKWSDPSTQKDPNVSKYYYAYLAYDAKTQRVAGSLVEDPAEKKRLLEAAAKRFELLRAPEMHKLYISQPDVKKQIAAGLDETDPDWQVQTGLALTDFDLGNYADAKKLLDPIIALKRLGTPRIAVVNAQGQEELKDNDLYWEALYNLIKSDYEVGRTNPEVKTASIKMLKNILLLGGIPERWQDEFEGMRAEAIPDFNPDKPTKTAPTKTAVPASAPAAK